MVATRSQYRSECRRVGAYDAKGASEETAINFEKARDRTQQSQAEETDINNIVRRFKVTGLLPQGVRRPTYGDFEGVSDFRTAMDAIIAAEKAFMAMPSDVRSRFGNDPALFVEFCSDDKNLDEMRKMGLAVPERKKPDPVEVRVMNAPETPANVPAGGK